MQKIRTFKHAFLRSLTSVEYYKDVIEAPFRFSMKYFSILIFLGSIIVSIYASVTLSPLVQSQYEESLTEIEKGFEDDLVITSNADGLSINKAEPYIITMPKTMSWEGTDIPEFFAVFDSDGTITDYNDVYSTLFLVNKVNLLTTSNNGVVRSYSLNQIPQGEFTKSDLLASFDDLRNFMRFFPVLLFLFVFLAVFVYFFLVKLFFLMAIAAVLFVAGKLAKLNLDYTDYLQLAIHVFTWVLLVQLLVYVSGVLRVADFWFFVANLILSLGVLAKLQKLVKQDVTYVAPEVMDGTVVEDVVEDEKNEEKANGDDEDDTGKGSGEE